MIDNPRICYCTYDADTHCPACAEARFGQALYDNPSPLDSEGNPVRPVYSWETADDAKAGVYCGTCGREIIPRHE